MANEAGIVDDDHGVGDRIDALIRIPGVDALVAKYFDPAGPFAGASFDTLEPGPPNTITVADLLAVSFLDVRVPPLAVRKILGDDAPQIVKLLAEVPSDCCLWNASDEVLDCADAVRRHLRGYRGVDWVTASKLFSRKRPHLIPVTDSVIVAALQAPGGTVWTSQRVALGDAERRRRIDALLKFPRGSSAPKSDANQTRRRSTTSWESGRALLYAGKPNWDLLATVKP